MQRSFQPVMTTIVLTAAMLLACVPVSAAVIVHDDGGIYDYPPLTTAAGDDVWAEGTTTVNLLTGGSIGWDLEAYDTSTVNVSGGSIADDLWAMGDSEVNVSGGTIADILGAYDDSTMTIFGTGFNFAYGDYTDGDSLDDQLLTGVLADGTAINNTLYIVNSATVTLAAPTAVPEPSSMAMFGIGALGLLGYSRRRRQTSATA